jgi:hypothetical protein
LTRQGFAEQQREELHRSVTAPGVRPLALALNTVTGMAALAAATGKTIRKNYR